MTGPNDARALGARIRAARDRAGLGQKQLARRAGLSTSTIGRYERGVQVPSWRALESIAAVLVVPLDWLRLGRTAGDAGGAVPDVVPVVEEITMLLGRLRILIGLPETPTPAGTSRRGGPRCTPETRRRLPCPHRPTPWTRASWRA